MELLKVSERGDQYLYFSEQTAKVEREISSLKYVLLNVFNINPDLYITPSCSIYQSHWELTRLLWIAKLEFPEEWKGFLE